MWYTKYMKAMGGAHLDNERLYSEISESMEAIGQYRPIEVSVVVIAYNEEQRLLACLWSLSQMISEHSIEVIVVDNNSSDRTSEIILRSGAQYIFQPLQGVGYARQAGLEAARGEIILSADADTLYPTTYADAMVAALRNPKLACVFTSYWFFEDGMKSRTSLNFYSRMRDVAIWFRSLRRPELAVGGAAMAFRRADALQVGWRCDIRRGEDGSMLLSLKKFGQIKLLLNSRVRIRSTSRTLDADGTMLQMIYKRLKRESKRIGAYLTQKKHYKDEQYNKIR